MTRSTDVAIRDPSKLTQAKYVADARLQKRSLRLAGRRTSLALEPEFWRLLERYAAEHPVTVPTLIALVDNHRRTSAPQASLAFAVRAFLCRQHEPNAAFEDPLISLTRVR